MAAQSPRDTNAIGTAQGPGATSSVICRREPGEEVRPRVRTLVDEIVDLEPSVPVLYVAASLPASSRTPAGRSREQQILGAVSEIGLVRSLLSISDAADARFAVRTGRLGPGMTGDCLLASVDPRERTRPDERLLLEYSQAVGVCSVYGANPRGRAGDIPPVRPPGRRRRSGRFVEPAPTDLEETVPAGRAHHSTRPRFRHGAGGRDQRCRPWTRCVARGQRDDCIRPNLGRRPRPQATGTLPTHAMPLRLRGAFYPRRHRLSAPKVSLP